MSNHKIGEELKQVIKTQLSNGEPAIVQATYKRLQNELSDETEIIRMMAVCLLVEMSDMMKNNRPFDEQNYTRLLNLLPDEDAL